jgi:hypothetical protein
LGWLVQSKQVPVESLSLTQLVVFTPLKTAYDAATSFEENRQIERAAQRAAERTLNLVQEYLYWLETERQVSFSTQRLQLEAVIDIAKFLYRDETDRFKGKPYSDVPVMVLLRKLRQELKQKAQAEPPAADVSLKWLDWDAFVRFVQQLERECLPQYNSQPPALSQCDRPQFPSLLNLCALMLFATGPTADAARTGVGQNLASRAAFDQMGSFNPQTVVSGTSGWQGRL